MEVNYFFCAARYQITLRAQAQGEDAKPLQIGPELE